MSIPFDDAGGNTLIRDPDSVLDYGFDWSDWLAEGETISESTWIVPTGLSEESSSNTDTATTIWLSGGTANQTYQLTNRIETSGTRKDDRTMIIRVRER